MKMRYWQMLFLALTTTLSACTSAVVSKPYSSDSRIEGLVYHLSATAMAVTATYELIKCRRGPEIKLVDVTLQTTIVPDPSKDATFEIDLDALTSMTTSVNPAKFTFNNGLLTAVTYKAKDESREILKQAVKGAISIGSFGILLKAADLTNEDQQKAVQQLMCNDSTRHARDRSEDLGTAANNLVPKLDAAKAAFLKDPTQEAADDIIRIKQQLTARLNEWSSHRDRTLRITVSEQRIPKKSDLLSSTSQTVPYEFQLVPNAVLFSKWFDDINNEYAREGLKTLTVLHFQLDNVRGDGADVDSPPSSGFRGIYYRIPATASVKVTHEASKTEKYFPELELLQLGKRAALRIENGPFKSRTVEITFDDFGRLKSFELTSTAVAREVLQTVTEVETEVQSAREKVLQDRLNLLQKQKELIEAEEALREVKSKRAVAGEDAPAQ